METGPAVANRDHRATGRGRRQPVPAWRRRGRFAAAVAVLSVCGAIVCWRFVGRGPNTAQSERRTLSLAEAPQTLNQLLSAQPDEMSRCDLVRMNLLCAEGLPGSEQLNIPACLETLAQ